jgi:Trm5-related predicted tRNA methylase
MEKMVEEIVKSYFEGENLEEAVKRVMAKKHIEKRAEMLEKLQNIKWLQEYMNQEV